MVGDIVDIQEQYGITVKVVSGGTAARAITSEINPELIIAVACERELASGIRDVGEHSVIGINNEAPNGPCNQTTVDIHLIRQYLNYFTKISCL